MFTAHSPDNSFMGFVVERHVETPPTLARNVSGDLMKKNQAVVYGKAEYMWSVRIAGVIYVRHTHTHPFNGPFSGTTQVSWYQKGKTNLDFTEARDSEWQCHQLSHMQVCTSLQTDNHASTPPLSFLQAGCPSCHPTNSV